MVDKDSERDRGKGPARRRVLFVAEAVTLAHVARPLVLAQALDPERYEVQFACARRFAHLLPAGLVTTPIESVAPEQFLRALAEGKPLYSTKTLRRYVEADLELLEAFRPDLVVGDFRLSLAVSARIAKVPYATITNAYWSPYARQHFPVPELPMTAILGVRPAQWLFSLARPVAFAMHSVPMQRVRRAYGLPFSGLNLARTYTEADLTLYADVPEVLPVHGAPPHHHYLGPILWSPSVARPPWWDEPLPAGRRVVYVTLGSSGRGEILRTVLKALADQPVTVLAATAGNLFLEEKDVPPNVRLADYLPGLEAAQRADLVICNGGSPTTQQALAAGCPVLGIPSNLDQYLNMQALSAAGAGISVRAGQAAPASIRAAALELLDQPGYAAAAARLSEAFARYDASGRFRALVEDCLKGR